MSRPALPSVGLLIAASLGGCASLGPDPAAVVQTPALTAAVLEIAPASALPTLEALDLSSVSPSPMAPPPSAAQTLESRDPAERIARANAAARIEPTRDGYANAVQVYAYDEGALFQVYASPGQITDIALQPGETLSATGPVAAGDTARWIIGDTVSGTGDQARVHILVKPTRAPLRTNLIINTDRRTYHLELSATASVAMASVSWRYPQDELIALRTAGAQAASRVIEPAIDLNALSFDYRISGADTPWRPLRAFDDGRQVFIEFGDGLGASSLPPLFVRGADSRSADLVNYRIVGRRMVVDRLFAVAELRLAGPGGRQQTVVIEKTGGRGR